MHVAVAWLYIDDWPSPHLIFAFVSVCRQFEQAQAFSLFSFLYAFCHGAACWVDQYYLCLSAFCLVSSVHYLAAAAVAHAPHAEYVSKMDRRLPNAVCRAPVALFSPVQLSVFPFVFQESLGLSQQRFLRLQLKIVSTQNQPRAACPILLALGPLPKMHLKPEILPRL